MANLSEQMAADALEAQKFSRKYLVLELDFSPTSIQELEQHFDSVEFSIKGGKSDENLQMLKRIWGAYLGEFLRRRMGGEWVTTSDVAGESIALRTPAGDLFPHEQVMKRLQGGSKENIWEYAKPLITA